ncbi:hypothetical protein GCM10009839_74860 [Catenulispora yoronensis]|uniref:Uncharacterized protein n=1 Tax=Catenulispora yoronensis TaxID=450799 RepID=A0ABP5GU85_9ACTN
MTTAAWVAAIALADPVPPLPALRPLPRPAAAVLEAVAAPPRLVAHLRAVHDVAAELVAWTATRPVPLGLDEDAVLFGAATHAAFDDATGLEDLLVSLADAVWKGKRRTDLEDLVVARLAAASGRPVWDEFLELDDVLTRIADEADGRLAFQMAYPLTAKP